AVAHSGFAYADAGGMKMSPEGRLVERVHAEAEVIEVATLSAGGGAAGPAELAIDGDQVDQRSAGPQLHHPQIILPLFNGAAEDARIEVDHDIDVGDPKHDVVDVADGDHARRVRGQVRRYPAMQP